MKRFVLIFATLLTAAFAQDTLPRDLDPRILNTSILALLSGYPTALLRGDLYFVDQAHSRIVHLDFGMGRVETWQTTDFAVTDCRRERYQYDRCLSDVGPGIPRPKSIEVRGKQLVVSGDGIIALYDDDGELRAVRLATR